MSHRAARILTLLLAAGGACVVATSAAAQSAPSTGRYLTWANRPASTTPADMSAAQTRARDAMISAADVTAAQPRARNAMIPRRVAPSQSPYRPTLQTPVAEVAVARGLTPASAWLGPRITPAYAPGSPDPIGDATRMAAADAPPPPPPPVEFPDPAATFSPVEPVAADPMAPRRDAPVFNLRRPAQAQPAQQSPAAQSVADADPSDPMAPRRDARIFQVQQDQTQGQEQAALAAPTQTVPSGEASVQSGQSGARYYSVHRDAGHRPDATALPEPVYFDSVTLDLAEPPPADDAPVRDPQGRRRVVPNVDPSLP